MIPLTWDSGHQVRGMVKVNPDHRRGQAGKERTIYWEFTRQKSSRDWFHKSVTDTLPNKDKMF